MQSLPAFIAAVLVTAYSLRGADSFQLVVIAGIAWSLAAVLIAIMFRFRPAAMKANRIWVAIGFAFLLTASVVFVRWPIRLGPVVYHSEFEALADRVAAGHSFSSPQRIGPFTFQRGEIERGFVCLWTNLAPSGRSGYIRGLPDGGSPFNPWSIMAVGSNWQFVVED